MDAQPVVPAGPRARVSFALADPHRGFLRRKVRSYLIACALVGVGAGGLGLVLQTVSRKLARFDYDARHVDVPVGLRDAAAQAAAGDASALHRLIPAHPSEALALLVDQEHAPESMGWRNPFGAMPKEASERLLRECAPLFPLERVGHEFGRIFAQRSIGQPGDPAAVERNRALTLLEAHPSPEALKLLEAFPAVTVRDAAFQARRASIVAAKRK